MATNFNVSSRQGFKFYSLSGAIMGLLMTIPCLSLSDPCLSFTIKMKMFLLTFPRPSGDHAAVFYVRYGCDGDGTVCSMLTAGVRLMRAVVGRVRVGPS